MKTNQATSQLNPLEHLIQDAEATLIRTAESHLPARYHLLAGGQRIRMRVCLDACLALSVSRQNSLALAVCIELLHNASLVHDDLQDGDEVRRGQQTVWAKYGKGIAVCTGDFLLTKAFAVLASCENDFPLAQVINEVQLAVSNTILGQCEDLEAKQISDEREYETIAAGKSGPLIALPIALPLIAAGKDECLVTATKAINCFAIAYQIADDLSDWRSDADNNHMNLVNLLRVNHSTNNALSLAQQRAVYLLKRCTKELSGLPNNCAYGIIHAALDMQRKLESSNYG